MDYVVLARAQKVAEWKDRKEAILRGEITATEGTSDADIDSIYDVQEEVSGTQYVHNCVLNVVFTHCTASCITGCMITAGCTTRWVNYMQVSPAKRRLSGPVRTLMTSLG